MEWVSRCTDTLTVGPAAVARLAKLIAKILAACQKLPVTAQGLLEILCKNR